MASSAENCNDCEPGHPLATDWPSLLRLAMVAGAVAALAAVALAGVVAETTIVVCVIVLATMASWFQLEHPRPQPRRIRVHHD